MAHAGTRFQQYGYDPFGNTTPAGASSTNVFQYTGRKNDGTGLYFNRARYYSPTFGRFISEDPIGFAGGINVYAYTGDSPTNFVDPLGLASSVPDYITLTIGGGLISAGGGPLTVNLHDGNVYGRMAELKGALVRMMFGKLNYSPAGSPSGAVVDSFLDGLSGYFCAGALAGVCQLRNAAGTAYLDYTN